MQHRLLAPVFTATATSAKLPGVLCFFANSADSVKLNDDLVLALW